MFSNSDNPSRFKIQSALLLDFLNHMNVGWHGVNAFIICGLPCFRSRWWNLFLGGVFGRLCCHHVLWSSAIVVSPKTRQSDLGNPDNVPLESCESICQFYNFPASIQNANNNIIIMAGMAVFNVAGYLIEERRRWPVITASPRGQCSK